MKKSLLYIAILCITSIGYAQRLQTPTLSPFTKISQEVGLTEIQLEYARPSAKGRVVFGNLVPYGKLWRTGANASSKLTFTEAVKIGGNHLEAGTYALYTIPNQDAWTIIVHANTKMRSLAGDAYKQENDVFRFEVTPQKGADFVETFTFQFADLKSSSVNLQLSWEHTIVNIPVEVEVDAKVVGQMNEFLKTPENIPHRTYFEAAQYYLNNDKDLNDAIAFINAALEKSENNFRYGLLKSKIQFAQGKKSDALKTVEAAHAWAKKANNANYIEQTALYKTDILKN